MIIYVIGGVRMKPNSWLGVDIRTIEPNEKGEKVAYNEKGVMIYYEDSDGKWENGNLTKWDAKFTSNIPMINTTGLKKL